MKKTRNQRSLAILNELLTERIAKYGYAVVASRKHPGGVAVIRRPR